MEEQGQGSTSKPIHTAKDFDHRGALGLTVRRLNAAPLSRCRRRQPVNCTNLDSDFAPIALPMRKVPILKWKSDKSIKLLDSNSQAIEAKGRSHPCDFVILSASLAPTKKSIIAEAHKL